MLRKVEFLKNSDARKLHASVCQLMRKLYSLKGCPGNKYDRKLLDAYFLTKVKYSIPLEEKIQAFVDMYFTLLEIEQVEVYRIFLETNAIPRLHHKKGDACHHNQLPLAIQDPTKDLFIYLFTNTLKTEKNRHYRNFYDKLPVRDCPICGIERVILPDDSTQDYDHLLCKDLYPMTAVNMRNLIPMGVECNRVYKKNKDILHDATGVRRSVNYPYSSQVTVSVELNGSVLPDATNRRGSWKVNLYPDIEEVRAWDDIYSISHRYNTAIYQNEYDDWRQDFIRYAQKRYPAQTWDKLSISKILKEFASDFPPTDYRGNKFLKHALYTFLANEAPERFFRALASQMNSLNKPTSS